MSSIDIHRYSKDEAIDLMQKGIKMRHRHFSDHEWAVISYGKMLFEDGVRCTQEMFWFDRRDRSWETDWAKYDEWNN